ncbi:hypothetical protein BDW59DRAFT_142995 [Aspergillus cavernicola]|uniref:Vacuolar membrane protein n=1 Tax=Aspergillus cavernicola TaxID=176166 RepID=A0ABR4IM01_9EURO
MLLLPMSRSTARRPYILLLLFVVIALFAQLAVAQDDSDSSSDTTDDSSDNTSTTTTDNYPVVTVPPTDDAPYMQKSTAPEGTVFIAVGAVLGAMGLSILAWRGLVAWSVNRSVRRAAVVHSSENKGLLRGKKKRSGRSHSRGHGSSHNNAVSLEKINGNRHSSYRDSRASKIPTSGSGLFFSPTAGMQNSGNRGSNYLPAGYYAAGNAAAGLAQNVGLSSDHLPPQVRGYTRTGSGPTPPATPMAPPQGMHEVQQYSNSNLRQSYAAAGSTSSLNLTSPPQGRTPSAYLEDLFENHPPRSPNRHN